MSLLRKLFGTSGNPSDATKLDGTSEAALARSLSTLPAGERGWITFAEARTFSLLIARFGTRAGYMSRPLTQMGNAAVSNRPSCHWMRVHSIVGELLPYDGQGVEDI